MNLVGQTANPRPESGRASRVVSRPSTLPGNSSQSSAGHTSTRGFAWVTAVSPIRAGRPARKASPQTAQGMQGGGRNMHGWVRASPLIRPGQGCRVAAMRLSPADTSPVALADFTQPAASTDTPQQVGHRFHVKQNGWMSCRRSSSKKRPERSRSPRADLLECFCSAIHRGLGVWILPAPPSLDR